MYGIEGDRLKRHGRGKEREREFLLEPHNWTHISTLFISSLRNDGRGLRRSRGTKARHEGDGYRADAKRAKERQESLSGWVSEFPAKTSRHCRPLATCPTTLLFSRKRDPFEEFSREQTFETLVFSCISVPNHTFEFLCHWISGKNSSTLFLDSLSLSLLRVNHGNGRACASTRFDARSDNTRAAVSGPGRFKPRETSSRFSFATLPPPKKAIVFVTRCSGVEWMFRSLQNRAFPGAKLRG